MSRKTVVKVHEEEIDLLRIPLWRACKAINLWNKSRRIFSDDFRKVFVDTEPGFNNAKWVLLERGKVHMDKDGDIAPVEAKNDTKRAKGAVVEKARR